MTLPAIIDQQFYVIFVGNVQACRGSPGRNISSESKHRQPVEINWYQRTDKYPEGGEQVGFKRCSKWIGSMKRKQRVGIIDSNYSPSSAVFSTRNYAVSVPLNLPFSRKRRYFWRFVAAELDNSADVWNVDSPSAGSSIHRTLGVQIATSVNWILLCQTRRDASIHDIMTGVNGGQRRIIARTVVYLPSYREDRSIPKRSRWRSAAVPATTGVETRFEEVGWRMGRNKLVFFPLLVCAAPAIDAFYSMNFKLMSDASSELS